MTRPPLALQEGQLVRVEYQEGRTQWWWAHYDDASVRPGEIGMLLGRTSDRWFENYRVRLIGRGHDVTFAARELNPCDLAAENEALRAQAEASQDTTDYDNAVTETVCDRLLDAIAGKGEPSFGGPRLNMIVRLIRDLRAQAEAGASLRAALDAAIQCEQDVVDAYGRGAPMVVLDEAVADLKRDSLPHLKRARAALGGQS
ncbi:hypothetical protein IHN63_03215 [Deinococcus sp. 6YEL10]|uniref:hypothetical protein n=1 Tax=Deinococcus sp. 6YEL10 TaxID=2745870 RepID=UPI001E28E35F|nr:hypothetical protein [Deinococcus sp. 6YEL10]MCD0160310.1 hypothetical protein [Deinococcus sp. 6YEL10]